MFIFDILSDVVENVVDFAKEKVEQAVEWVKDKLGNSSYDSSSVSDQIDVDKVLSEFRESIQGDIDLKEEESMNNLDTLFIDLKKKTQARFSDLVIIINEKQKEAKKELNGTVMQYIKEHLSKNDEKFVTVLKMKPGQAKQDALDVEAERIFSEADAFFCNKLKGYIEEIQREFTTRLETRLKDQECQLEEYIIRLEKMQEQTDKGDVNVDEIINDNTPMMESAECIKMILEMD